MKFHIEVMYSKIVDGIGVRISNNDPGGKNGYSFG